MPFTSSSPWINPLATTNLSAKVTFNRVVLEGGKVNDPNQVVRAEHTLSATLAFAVRTVHFCTPDRADETSNPLSHSFSLPPGFGPLKFRTDQGNEKDRKTNIQQSITPS